MLVRSDSMIKVGFQGVSGSFSEEALFNYFANDIETIAFHTFEDVFIGVEKGDILYGILPIENSSTGAISDVYDLLNQYNLYIVGEKYIKVRHNLLGVKNSQLSDIKEVYSHPQAFEQSKDYLNQFTNWKLIPYYNTAKSAEYISQLNNKEIAAIGSRKASELYHLNLLAENINSNKKNTTRFVVVGSSLEINQDFNKISMVISTHHKAGALFHVLKNFAENKLNLLKIESRPIKHTPWEYYFYIDFEGHLEDPIVKDAIAHLEKDCTHFKLLGHYKGELQL